MTIVQTSYDEALFRQLLSKRKKSDGSVSLTDIHVVFQVVAWDVYQAIEEQKPEEFDTAQEYVMETVVPELAEALQIDGWKIWEYEASKKA